MIEIKQTRKRAKKKVKPKKKVLKSGQYISKGRIFNPPKPPKEPKDLIVPKGEDVDGDKREFVGGVSIP